MPEIISSFEGSIMHSSAPIEYTPHSWLSKYLCNGLVKVIQDSLSVVIESARLGPERISVSGDLCIHYAIM